MSVLKKSFIILLILGTIISRELLIAFALEDITELEGLRKTFLLENNSSDILLQEKKNYERKVL